MLALSVQTATNRTSFCVLRTVACLQTPQVRWVQIVKPYWIGIAKSKMFKFPPLIERPKDEAEEFMRVKKNWMTYQKSLRGFLAERYHTDQVKKQSEARETTEDAEYERICAEIDQDNSAVKEHREKALVEEWEETKQQILTMRRQYEEEERLRLEQTEKKLLSEMERLEKVISKEELDEAIERVLSGPETDYNFAIDKEGTRFQGRVTHIKPIQSS